MTNAESRRKLESQNLQPMKSLFGFGPSSLVIRYSRLSWLLVLLGSLAAAFAQRQADQRPPPLDPVQARSEARSLVADLLAQKPPQNSTNTGQVRIRDRDGKEIEVPARFEITCTATNWSSVYESLKTADSPGGAKLTVIHSGNQPNQYQLIESGPPGNTNPRSRKLTPDQTMLPFAGSDFWAADLGLEFLHWPDQRLLRKEMRHSKSCYVLESVNPQTPPGGYTRVVSWIIIESPHGIVHADAYDARNELLKIFDPVNLEKVHGDYQLEEVEMRNRKTGSHTWIKFDLAHE